MYEYLRGKLVSSTPLQAIVDVGGIGFRLLIPVSSYGRLPAAGQEVFLYVAQVIREDAHTFYGFLAQEERDLFFSFCAVSGIGPKTALSLVGHMDIHTLYLAISQGQLALLCKIPGIGRKTAERLVIEMRDRLQPKEKQVALAAIDPSGQNTLVVDAMNALINLGYNALQAQKALTTALASSKQEDDLAILITSALRHL
jgi:holliday junction DNA helicase RuvA